MFMIAFKRFKSVFNTQKVRLKRKVFVLKRLRFLIKLLH
jgi:hypothetical protein